MHANKSISVISGSHNYHNHFSSVIKDSLSSIRDLFHTQARFVLSHHNKQCGRISMWHFSAQEKTNQPKTPTLPGNWKHTFVSNLIWSIWIKAGESRSSRVLWFLKKKCYKTQATILQICRIIKFTTNHLIIWLKITTNIDGFHS